MVSDDEVRRGRYRPDHSRMLRASLEARDDLHARIVLDLLDRRHRADGGGFEDTLTDFVGKVSRRPDADRWVRAAVLANQLGVICFGDVADFESTAALVDRHGHATVAAIQNTLDGWLGTGPDLPLTTEAVVALVRTAEDDRIDAQVRGVCERAGYLLLLEEDVAAGERVSVTTVDDLHRLLSGTARDWRAFYATIGMNPWRPYATEVQELAHEAGMPWLADAVATCTALYRERREEEERAMVAGQIRAAIGASGCTQREFAQHVGTSASRLSTYVTGRVTPSAAMMLRINRTARALGAAARRTRERLPA